MRGATTDCGDRLIRAPSASARVFEKTARFRTNTRALALGARIVPNSPAVISCNRVQRRGFVVLTALAGLLVLMVVAALFLHYGIQGLRQEHMQDLSAQCDQIVLSLRDLSRREGDRANGEMREIAIDELLPSGAQGTAWLGSDAQPGGGWTVKCRIQIELGRDRLNRVFEWIVGPVSDRSLQRENSP